ncbi:ArsR/SmtB family transcription factor [Amedibacillus sp. YH-ame10]
MKAIYKKNVDFIREANLFLRRYCEDDNFTEMKEHLKKKTSYTKEIEHIINEMGVVYNEILDEMENSLKEEIHEHAFYFKSYVEDEDSLDATIADCMSFEAWSMDEENMSLYHNRIKESFHKNPSCFIDCVIVSNELDAQYSDEEVLRLLDESDLKDEIKWKVYQIYLNFDQHLNIVMGILEKVIPVMKRVYKNHENAFEAFHSYWSEVCESGRFMEALQIHVKFELEEDVALWVKPSWMGCNGLRLMALNEKDKLHVLIGLMFTDHSFIGNEEVSMEDACARIKLLSDPSKYEILKLIKNEGLYGSQLAEKLKLTTATISHHVSALSNASLIAYEKDSNRVYYRSNKEQIGYLLDQMRSDLYDD